MSKVDAAKVETALNLFGSRNCAQAVLAAHAGDYGLETEKALQVAVAFGGGMGRIQDVCGAVSGALMVLGLSSGFREEDGRDKINLVYDRTRELINDFTKLKGTIKCSEILGCDLKTEEGQKFFKENNLRERCCEYIQLACELLEKHSFGSV